MSGEAWQTVLFTLKASAASTLLILPIGIDSRGCSHGVIGREKRWSRPR
jgi:hypothetical protein